MLYLFLYESARQSCAGLIQALLQMGQFYNGVFENNVAIYCANLKPILSRFRANTTFHNFIYNFCPEPDGTGGHPMEPKKLAKPRKNGAFTTRQAVMKPDEETGGGFPTMKPID